MIRILYGVEKYLIDKEIKKYTEKVSDINISVYDEWDSSIYENAITVPFLDNKKVIVVYQEVLTEDFKKLSDIPESTDILIVVPRVDKRSKVFKENVHIFSEYQKLNIVQLTEFIKAFVTKRGGHINDEACEIFIQRMNYFEDESVTLYSIILNLKRLLFQPEITVEAVSSSLQAVCNDKVFDMINAITSKNSTKSIMLAKTFIEQGEEPIALLSLLLRCYRLSYKAGIISDKKKIGDEIGLTSYQMRSLVTFNPQITSAAIDIIQSGINDIKNGRGKDVFFSTLGKVLLL